MNKSARKFLKHFPNYWIQTFDDKKQGAKANYSLNTNGPPQQYTNNRLIELNEEGAGIFFSVNQFSEARKTKKCEGVNAWIAEYDEIEKDKQKLKFGKAPLEPSFMVESRNSIHAYWLTEEDKREKAVDSYRGIQEALIRYFESDEAIKDITRVMRIPGFYHNKQDPWKVKTIKSDPDIKYSPAEMKKNFPYEDISNERTESGEIFVPESHQTEGAMKFWDHLSQLPDKKMLKRLSGEDIVNNEKITFEKRPTGGEYILVNGEQADAWIDEKGEIGSGKGGGPTWIQWMEYYDDVEKADIAEWFKENCQDLMLNEYADEDTPDFNRERPDSTGERPDPKITTAKDHKVDIVEKFKNPTNDITWGRYDIDKEMPIIERGHYVVLFGQHGAGKTTFCLFMARQNAKQMDNVMFLTLEMSKQQLITSFLRNRADISKTDWRQKTYSTDHAMSYLEELENLKLAGIDRGEIYDIPQIEEVIKEHEPSMLFIDNLNKIEGSKGQKRELTITKDVSAGILNLTNQYNIPIIVIHHANKPKKDNLEYSKKYKDEEKTANKNLKDFHELVKFRGQTGMRGTNKTADDADTIVELARSKDSDEYYINTEKEDRTAGLKVYKDREFDEKNDFPIYFKRGEFFEDYSRLQEKEWRQRESAEELVDALTNND